MPEILTKKIGRKPVFDKVYEDMLVKYALILEDKLFGLTQMDVRRISYHLAVRNNLSNPFKDNKGARYWLSLKTRPNIINAKAFWNIIWKSKRIYKRKNGRVL